METIFDHSPSVQEIEVAADSLRPFNLRPTKEEYEASISPDMAIFDIAILLRGRKQFKESAKYFEKIPDLAEEFKFGFDNAMVAVD